MAPALEQLTVKEMIELGRSATPWVCTDNSYSEEFTSGRRDITVNKNIQIYVGSINGGSVILYCIHRIIQTETGYDKNVCNLNPNAQSKRRGRRPKFVPTIEQLAIPMLPEPPKTEILHTESIKLVVTIGGKSFDADPVVWHYDDLAEEKVPESPIIDLYNHASARC